MKKLIAGILFFFITTNAYPQFEQKLSLNLTVGGFKTFGKAMGEYNYDPMQMPHYRPGINAGAALQYNFSRHFSFMIDASILYSGSWHYNMFGTDFLHYTITDTVTNHVLAEGENKLNLFNFSIDLVPKYYLFAVRKWNPYIFCGFNFNYTSAKYIDNYFKDAQRLNRTNPGDTPAHPFLENNKGLGFLPGLGIEYIPTEKLSYFVETGYSQILLNKENFKSPYDVENFNAIILRAGIRISFLKSKNI